MKLTDKIGGMFIHDKFETEFRNILKNLHLHIGIGMIPLGLILILIANTHILLPMKLSCRITRGATWEK